MSPRRRVHRIRFHVSLAGWLFVGVATVVGAAAVKTQLAMMFLVCGAMLGAMVLSAVMSWRMVGSVELCRDVSDRAWQNRTVHLGYSLRNRRPRGACLGLSVQEVEPEGIHSAGGFCVHLSPRQVFRAGGRFLCRRRGVIVLRGSRISTTFPFGLVRAHRLIEEEASILIWPARGTLKRQLLHRGAVETSRAAPSPVSGGQDEFFGLREYRTDDNPRWIHWRKSASKAIPVVREMSRPLPEILWVVLDTHLPVPSQDQWDRREKLIRFAGTLVDHALAKGYQVALALAYQDGARTFEPSSGRGQLCALLDALAKVDVNTRVPMGQTVRSLRRASLGKAQAIAITPRASAGSGLQVLRRSCGHLTVVDLDLVDHVFEDDPLSVEDA